MWLVLVAAPACLLEKNRWVRKKRMREQSREGERREGEGEKEGGRRGERGRRE